MFSTWNFLFSAMYSHVPYNYTMEHDPTTMIRRYQYSFQTCKKKNIQSPRPLISQTLAKVCFKHRKLLPCPLSNASQQSFRKLWNTPKLTQLFLLISFGPGAPYGIKTWELKVLSCDPQSESSLWAGILQFNTTWRRKHMGYHTVLLMTVFMSWIQQSDRPAQWECGPRYFFMLW